MDWSALTLSLKLAGWTVLILLPLGIWAGHALAAYQFRGKAWVEALMALPLFGFTPGVATSVGLGFGYVFVTAMARPALSSSNRIFRSVGFMTRVGGSGWPCAGVAHGGR